MPRPLRPCAQPRCPTLTDQRRCPVHRGDVDRARGNSNARGYTKRWRNYARAYLARYPLCYYCERAGRTTASECVDHATPPSRGGDFWNPDNHRPSCKHDNDAKGDRTETEYLRALGVHA